MKHHLDLGVMSTLLLDGSAVFIDTIGSEINEVKYRDIQFPVIIRQSKSL